MSKKYISVFLSLLCALCVHAAEVTATIDGDTYLLNDADGTAKLTKAGSKDTIVVPSTVSYGGTTYTVTTIGTNAVIGERDKVLKLPPTIKECENNSFQSSRFSEVHISDLSAWCRITFGIEGSNPLNTDHTSKDRPTTKLMLNDQHVTDLVIPDDVTEISAFAFRGYDLNSLTTTSVEVIGRCAFYESNIGEIWLGSRIHTIEAAAFKFYYTNDGPKYMFIMSPTKPDIVDIGKGTKIFYPWKFESYWSGGPSSSSNYSFHNSGSLDFSYLPDHEALSERMDSWFDKVEPDSRYINQSGVLYYVDLKNGENAIVETGTATDANVLPEITCEGKTYPVTDIRSGAFRYRRTETVTLPETIKSIGYNAFFRCGSLASINFPPNLERIGQQAFYECVALSEIDLPASLKYVGTEAFFWCGATKLNAYCPNAEFEPSVFYGCKKLTEATITLPVIPENTFKSCSALKKVTFGEGTTVIDRPLEACNSLTDTYLPASLKTIDPGYDPMEISDVHYHPVNVHITDLDAYMDMDVKSSMYQNTNAKQFVPEYIGGNLYLNGKIVEELTLPHGVSVKPAVFCGCGSLKKVTIGDIEAEATEPDPDYYVGEYAFAYCARLDNVYVAAHRIENYAFYGPRYLHASLPFHILQFGKTPVSLAYNITGSRGVKKLIIPAGKITEFAFYAFATITEAHFGEGVTEIEESAFNVSAPEHIYLYRYAPEPTKLLNSLYSSTETVHVPIGRKYEAPAGAPYTGCYLDYTTGKIKDDNVIEDLPNPLLFETRLDAGLAFSADRVAAFDDMAFTPPVLSKKTDARVTYSISDSSVADVDPSTGAVTIHQPGTATVTATTQATAAYQAGEASYTLVIVRGEYRQGFVGDFFYEFNPATFTARLIRHNNYKYMESAIIPETVEWAGDTYTVTEIGENAFTRCGDLATVVIPDGVTTIGAYAFQECDMLKSVQLGESVETICEYAFYYCPLESITIPASVKLIEGRALHGCYIPTVIVEGYTPPQAVYDTFYSASYTNATLTVPAGAAEAYRSAECWKEFANINESAGIESAGADAAPMFPADIYTTGGTLVRIQATEEELHSLTPGIYIVRSGSRATKVAIR